MEIVLGILLGVFLFVLDRRCRCRSRITTGVDGTVVTCRRFRQHTGWHRGGPYAWSNDTAEIWAAQEGP